MSIDAMRRVAPVQLKHASDKAVLNALAYFHGPTGVWPSIAALVDHTCLTRRAVQTSMRRLETAGYLRTTGKIHNGPRTYALMAEPATAAIAPPQRNTQGRTEFAPQHPKGRTEFAPAAHWTPKRGAQSSPNLERSLLILTDPLTNGTREPGKSLAAIMAEAGLPPIPGILSAPKERQPGPQDGEPDRGIVSP